MTSRELRFKFNREKAIELILYIATRLPNADYHGIAKTLYEADKLSLERYGRYVSGDEYYAMDFGPVPSEIYDLMSEPANRPLDAIKVVRKHCVKPLREPNMDWLSDSDRECLDEAIEKIRAMSFDERTAASHDEPYLSAWEARGASKRAHMSIEHIAKKLDGSGELLDFLKNRYAD